LEEGVFWGRLRMMIAMDNKGFKGKRIPDAFA
jgi:hypothetical protein